MSVVIPEVLLILKGMGFIKNRVMPNQTIWIMFIICQKRLGNEVNEFDDEMKEVINKWMEIMKD